MSSRSTVCTPDRGFSNRRSSTACPTPPTRRSPAPQPPSIRRRGPGLQWRCPGTSQKRPGLVADSHHRLSTIPGRPTTTYRSAASLRPIRRRGPRAGWVHGRPSRGRPGRRGRSTSPGLDSTSPRGKQRNGKPGRQKRVTADSDSLRYVSSFSRSGLDVRPTPLPHLYHVQVVKLRPDQRLRTLATCPAPVDVVDPGLWSPTRTVLHTTSLARSEVSL